MHMYRVKARPSSVLNLAMSRRLFSPSLLRDISDVAYEIGMLTSSHQPSSIPEIQTMPLRLPDVWTPSQYLINIGFRPALAQRLSGAFMDIVSRYKQVFESYFRRAIQGSYHHPEHYSDIFVIHFKSTIQELASRMVSAAWVWLCRARVSPAFSRSQNIDVRISVVATFDEIDISSV